MENIIIPIHSHLLNYKHSSTTNQWDMSLMIFLQLTSIYGWVLVIWNLICMISWAFLNMLSFKINYYIIHKSNLNPYQKMFMVRPNIALFTPTQIRHFIFRLEFIWYVYFYPPSFSNPHNTNNVPTKFSS